MEDSEERRGDKGEQTHAKPPPTPPPTASGDLGSGDRGPPPLRKRGEHQIVAGASGGRGRGQLKIQLVIQRIQDARGGECIVLWDSGAQVSLGTHEYARGAGFKRRPASIRITGVGAGRQRRRVQRAVQGFAEKMRRQCCGNPAIRGG